MSRQRLSADARSYLTSAPFCPLGLAWLGPRPGLVQRPLSYTVICHSLSARCSDRSCEVEGDNAQC
eukprot:7392760-Pyramimonas_sp.AAC.1